jgi:uncharacterized protein YbaP (TraB family)
VTRPFKFLAALLLPFALLATPAALAREPVAASATIKAKPALWVVKDKDSTIYLFGTVHVMKPGYEWFDDGVKKAFDASDELVLEVIEPEDQAAMGREMGALGTAPKGTPALSTRLGEEEGKQYVAAMEQSGLPWQAFEQFKPWMAGMVLSVAPLARLGYDPKYGVEKVLSAAAKETGKKMGALETVPQQLGFFNGLDDTQQIAFLNATVAGLPQAENEFSGLMNNWAKGDPDALAEGMNESLEATPVLAKVLIEDRNATWAQWIRKRLETPGTTFVAVGAGHLAGSISVQEKLKALGIQAQRVPTGL